MKTLFFKTSLLFLLLVFGIFGMSKLASALILNLSLKGVSSTYEMDKDIITVYMKTVRQPSDSERTLTIKTFMRGKVVGEFNRELFQLGKTGDADSNGVSYGKTYQVIAVTAQNNFIAGQRNTILVQIWDSSARKLLVEQSLDVTVKPQAEKTAVDSSFDQCSQVVAENVDDPITICCQRGNVSYCETAADPKAVSADPKAAAADPKATSNGAPVDNLYNPLGAQNDSLTDFLVTILKGFLAITAMWSVMFIVVGGFRMVISQGNEEAVGVAKKTITWAVLGLVVTLLSFSIIAIVQNLIGVEIPKSQDVGSSVDTPAK